MASDVIYIFFAGVVLVAGVIGMMLMASAARRRRALAAQARRASLKNEDAWLDSYMSRLAQAGDTDAIDSLEKEKKNRQWPSS